MIDWNFIGDREGGRRLTGYVPATELSNSGVTVGIGVDLGGVTPADLPESIRAILAPYCGLHGTAAQAALDQAPLVISVAQADALDTWAAARITSPLIARWSADSTTPWLAVPDRLQTVVTSVAYQYGQVWKRCPKFWARATALDVQGVVDELEDFGDAYPSRRKIEAEYLKPLLEGRIADV